MGNDDIVVGKKSQMRAPKSVIAENMAERAGVSAPTEASGAKLEQHCGAMSQQRGDSSAISTPQKFVRLVGCREAKARPQGTR